MPPVVTLAGVPLGGSTFYEWPLRYGVEAHSAEWEVTEQVAEQLQQVAATPTAESPGITYKVERNGQTVQQVEGLFLLEVKPGGQTHTRRIRVVDRRWLLKFTHVYAAYNERRVTGDVFLVEDGRGLEQGTVLPEIRYARYSLRDGREIWTAEDMLRDVLSRIVGTRFRIEINVNGLEVQDLLVDDPGHFALERALAYVPGAVVFCDYDGDLVIRSETDGSEQAVFDSLPAHQVEVVARMLDRNLVRPREIEVLIGAELECRFDYEEAAGTVVADTPRLTNVSQLMGQALEINGVERGAGSWEDINDLFTAYGAGPGLRISGPVAGPLSHEILRNHSTADYKFVVEAYTKDRLRKPDPIWAARFNTITRDWRTAFQIDPEFMGRLSAVRPIRAAVVNTALGTRAASPVYADWTERPTTKGWATTGDYHEGTQHGAAHRGWATLLADATAAPADVAIVNPGAGVFRILPRHLDTRGNYSWVKMGYPTEVPALGNIPGLPAQSLGGSGPDRDKYIFSIGWDHVTLEAGWKFSTVMSVVPHARFHSEVVAPDDVATVLGQHPGACNGPRMQIRVGEGVITARFAWNDGEASNITAAIRGDLPMPTDLLANPNHVRDVAVAAAARVYARLLDRPHGRVQVDAGNYSPTGALRSVRQSMQGGATVSVLDFGSPAAPADIWRFLPASTRRAIQRNLVSATDPLTASLG